jgi:hypothetical protein
MTPDSYARRRDLFIVNVVLGVTGSALNNHFLSPSRSGNIADKDLAGNDRSG